jgi:hypothetical protein
MPLTCINVAHFAFLVTGDMIDCALTARAPWGGLAVGTAIYPGVGCGEGVSDPHTSIDSPLDEAILDRLGHLILHR